jgi:hypothetical protein
MEDGFYGELIGNPTAAEHYFEPQTQNLDCEEMAVADVVGQETGHQPGEAEITTLAEHTPSTVNVNPATGQPEPVYVPSTGTALQDAPELLAHYHVSAQYFDNTTATVSGAPGSGLEVLQQDLAAGDKVIAGVDGPYIWNAIGDGPANDPGHADHVVVVTGIDTTKGVVYLNDSGVPNGGDEAVPISVFQHAWDTSGDAMVVAQPTGHDEITTVPAGPAQATPTPAASGGYGLAGGAGLAAAAGATAAYWANQRRNKNRKGTPLRPRPNQAMTS